MANIRVRVAVLVNAEGKWAAYGWTDADKPDVDGVIYDMMHDHETETAKLFYLTAEIPLPEATEIAAAVEPAT